MSEKTRGRWRGVKSWATEGEKSKSEKPSPTKLFYRDNSRVCPAKAQHRAQNDGQKYINKSYII